MSAAIKRVCPMASYACSAIPSEPAPWSSGMSYPTIGSPHTKKLEVEPA